MSAMTMFPQLILRLELASGPLYYAERGPLLMDVDGVETLFAGGFTAGEIVRQADLFGTGVITNDVQVQVDLPPSVNVATLIANPAGLYGSSATIYVYSGGTFNDATRFAFGKLTAPILADPVDPQLLGFTVSRNLLDNGYSHLIGEHMDESSFSSGGFGPDEADVGRYYPIPIGQPGIWSESPTGYTRAYTAVRACGSVPAAPAGYRFVVALGLVNASEAHVWYDNVYGGTADLVADTDLNGVVVTRLDWTTYSGTAADAEVSPTYVALVGEGISDTRGGYFSGLGDVVVWALGKTSLARNGFIDWPRVLGNVDALNALGRIDTVILERVHLLDWLIDILKFFPVFIDDAGDGLYVDLWRYDFTDSDVELDIDVASPGYERRSAISYAASDTYSSISVNGLQTANGKYLLNVTLSGISADIEAGALSHPLLQESYRLFGVNELDLEVPCVQDAATVARLAQFYAYKYALPRGSVGYAVPWRKVTPRVGMAARINDPAAGLENRRGIVSGYRYVDGELQVSISLLP